MSEHDANDAIAPPSAGLFASGLPHIAARIFGVPLLVEPTKLQAILWALSQRMALEVEQPADSAVMQPAAAVGRWERLDMDRRSGLIIDQGVGVLSITGTLVNRGRWIGTYSGLQSYDGIAQQLRMAAEDERIKFILLDLNTYGGEACGCADLASEIRELCAMKPVTALVADAAASAGYWLAASAEEVVVTETGLTGSIGVVLTHQDLTEMARMKGVKITQIHAGAEKLLGSPFKPLSESDVKKLQAEVDQLYDLFVARIAEYRGISADAVRATEANVYRAQAAVRAGLADRMMTGRALLAELQARASISGASRTNPKGNVMTKPNQGGADTPAATFTQEQLDAARAEGYVAGLAEGRAVGAMEGAASELTRVKAVHDQKVPGHEALVEKLMFDGKTTGPEAAVQILGVERAQRKAAAENLRTDAPRAVPDTLLPSAESKPAADMPLDERCKGEWQTDANLRREFDSVESYVAYSGAKERGLVRILRKKSDG